MAITRGTGARPNALPRELSVSVRATSRATPEQVFDVLADLSSHAEWGGERQRPKARLVSIGAPAGPASVGTEFHSSGTDPMGRFTDRSVVTEASRPAVFEFVTDARLETKRGRSTDWTLIHRYELEPQSDGCRLDYTIRLTRVSDLFGGLVLFKVPGLRALGMKASAALARRGVRNLTQLAEERAGIR
ncbi:MAG TPA: SRPBCC family protein [Actinomycetota bacterium]|nr:SRPBCC family protein [Actinomycetota bacterium]